MRRSGVRFPSPALATGPKWPLRSVMCRDTPAIRGRDVRASPPANHARGRRTCGRCHLLGIEGPQRSCRRERVHAETSHGRRDPPWPSARSACAESGEGLDSHGRVCRQGHLEPTLRRHRAGGRNGLADCGQQAPSPMRSRRPVRTPSPPSSASLSRPPSCLIRCTGSGSGTSAITTACCSSQTRW